MSTFHRLVTCLVAFCGALALHAQSSPTGRITGRIFNPTTQEYVRNAEIAVEGSDIVAFSADDGSYVLPPPA